MNFLNKATKVLFYKTLDIRQGELSRVLLVQLNIFLLITTLLIVKPTVNSLFLSDLGAEKLPFAFILVALVAAVITTLYSNALKKIPINKIIINTLLISVISLISFGILLRLNILEKWLLYMFYIWVAIFAILSASQFWILANIAFNAREAKRLFGLIGGAAITGGIFGGYLTSIIAPLLGSENLLFVSAMLLIICIPVTRTIWKKSMLADSQTPRTKSREVKVAEHPFRIIRNSKYLTYLALLTGLGVLVAKLVDYQFVTISSYKVPDPDELTAFFGVWLSNINLLSLIIQLFITRRVVGVYGVGVSLFFLPAGILFGSVSLMLVPGLATAIFIKLCDGGLKQSINKAAVELLALPIPAEIKNQTKIFIDVFVDSLATGIGGLSLVFIINSLNMSPTFVSLLVIPLLLLWFYVASRVRKEYINTFKIKIGQIKDNKNKQSLDFSKNSVISGLTRVLEFGSENQIIYVLRKVRELNETRLFQPIHKLINHESPDVRVEVLQTLYFYKGQNITEEVIPLIDDENQKVKIAAFEYLIKHTDEDLFEFMARYLKYDDYQIRDAALLSLAIETKDNLYLKRAFKLENLIKTNIEKLSSISDVEIAKCRKLNLLKVIGHAAIQKYYSFIDNLLLDEDTDIANQAILSAGQTHDIRFIYRILGLIEKELLRESIKTAIMNFGSTCLDVIRKGISENIYSPEITRHIPSVVERLGIQASVDFLFDLLDHEDTTVRLRSLYSLNNIKYQFPFLKFNNKYIINKIFDEVKIYHDTLSALYSQQIHIQPGKDIKEKSDINKNEARTSLIALLERRLDGNLERIFKLLGLKYPPEDIESIYKGIKSDKPDLRINAIEFLDNLLESNLKKVLIPIIETAILDTISKEALKNLHLKVPDQYECFSMLIKGKDIKIKLAVLYLIEQLKEQKYIPLVKPYINSDNIKIRTFAIRAFEVINQN